ncbi:hypothetical protein [Subtercola boreus]|uniref:Di-and tripeptidase n=1 Tax=Subtercola boreus TaxID=120213 RepID=A0A3E0W9P3_9MICO|nr:hypothetical protein [Subtercola boreus]RFA20346.1 hypothetical protein B7R24_10125 [Subtercola boreus]RFA20500.1 hypothetical protein B7R23_10065 [Subtercola boreus]RFA26749.1 hypothetical protein B7R25_10190 [Subtercola boreus]
MAKSTKPLPAEANPADANPADVNPKVIQGIDRVLSIHRPVVIAHIRSMRKRHPGYTPAQLISALERHYLAAVTTGGAAVGATSAVPAVGTAASLALTGVETLGFLEASALFAQSITEIHGIAVENPDRARALVMSLLMGSGGADLVQQLAKQAGGAGTGRSEFWGTMVTKNLPQAAVGPIADQMKKTFLKHFLAWTGSTAVGRLLPFGVGAVVGGAGNNILGRRVVKSARSAFGPAPTVFPVGTEPTIKAPTVRAPEAPKPPKAVKPGKMKISKPPKPARESKAKPATPSKVQKTYRLPKEPRTPKVPTPSYDIPQAAPTGPQPQGTTPPQPPA